MEVSTKELRVQPGKIIDQVAHGEEVTVTYRGRPLAKIVPIERKAISEEDSEVEIFGMWKNHNSAESVEHAVRELRKGRPF